MSEEHGYEARDERSHRVESSGAGEHHDTGSLREPLSGNGRGALWGGLSRVDGVLRPAGVAGTGSGTLSRGRQRASRPGASHGRDLGPARGRKAYGGPAFDQAVPAGGYHWWYADGTSDCGRFAFTVIAFIGSVFSPYYHWSGRRDPDNHLAFNVALYGPDGHAWAMTERGRGALSRDRSRLQIGKSSISFDGTGFVIAFDETFLPWPGQRILPRRMRGQIELTPAFIGDKTYALDPEAQHIWQPVAPSGRVSLSCDGLVNRGWVGQGYHDMNFGSRPLEADFVGWDWARGETADGRPILLYDSILSRGANSRFGLTYSTSGEALEFDPPERQVLKRGFWGVGGGIACDDNAKPALRTPYEDTPFYRRSLVETEIAGDRVLMMHETLDCRRLAMPLVRLMLPFRMPRRG